MVGLAPLCPALRELQPNPSFYSTEITRALAAITPEFTEGDDEIDWVATVDARLRNMRGYTAQAQLDNPSVSWLCRLWGTKRFKSSSNDSVQVVGATPSDKLLVAQPNGVSVLLAPILTGDTIGR